MNDSYLVPAAFATAVVVAIRSTWSPCGISMLSTLTPMSERARSHRYAVTVGWFVAGALIAGAVLGTGLGGLAWLVSLAAPAPRTVAAIVVAVSIVTIASDARVGGFSLPRVPRQVDENWINRYRQWVYASGFGAQIGLGLVTYVMTAGLYLLVALAILAARPEVALLLGVTFGGTRGLAILLGARLRTPSAVRDFHRRFEAAAAASLRVAIVAQAVVLAGAAAVALGTPAGWTVLAIGGATAVLAVLTARSPRGMRTRRLA